jgi:hypothetical protein
MTTAPLAKCLPFLLVGSAGVEIAPFVIRDPGG